MFDLHRPRGTSYADVLADMPVATLAQLVAAMTDAAARTLLARPWWFVRRPEQECPADTGWSIWLILSGRGWGKTRTGAETLLEWVLDNPSADGAPTEWAIIAETLKDTREVCLLGPSGIKRALERRGLKEGTDWTYHSTFGVITITKDGQKIHLLGADDADVGRGYNLSGAWLDEIAKWRYSWEGWIEGIMPALRVGKNPRVIVTTTPKPIRLLKDWLKRTDGSVHVTRGSTFDNRRNLSRTALAELKRRYAGTRTGRQELYGELLEDVEGALFNQSQIDADRVLIRQVELYRVVIAVDPAISSAEDSDETGIVGVGAGVDQRGYVLADRSGRYSPMEWAQKVVDLYDELAANEIVVEVNQGGEMVASTLRQLRPGLPITEVHAKKAKRVRAEPVSVLYEQHRVSHVGDKLATLEDQITTWTPEEPESPDRLDALVYACLALFENGDAADYLQSLTSLGACTTCGVPFPAGATRCLIHG